MISAAMLGDHLRATIVNNETIFVYERVAKLSLTETIC